MAEDALTVTALTRYIKYKFEADEHLKNILLKGEISNFKHNVRGHFYFTLKDDRAQISAVMFKGNAWRVPFEPEDGMSVLVRGYVDVFERSGGYQIYVESMEQAGIGNLYQQYLKLKNDLEKAGLFDERHKKAIPMFPTQIAVVTSRTGAVIRDILHVIARRYPLCKVLLYPTAVQGEHAKEEIVKNIERANENPDNDVIIVGRGGGSIEDLWPFNEAIVAHAIFDSKLPIISAVGHQTDYTIADFVSDKRAPTPSAAAEIAVPDKMTLLERIDDDGRKLRHGLKTLLKEHTTALNRIMQRTIIKDPSRIVMPYSRQYEYIEGKLRLMHPRKQLAQSYDTLSTKEKALRLAYQSVVNTAKNHYEQVTSNLEYVNPLSIMKKGYTMVRKDGKILKKARSIDSGDAIEVVFSDGRVTSTVDTVILEDEE